MNKPLNALGLELKRRLAHIHTADDPQREQLINVPHVGRVVSRAYEQLRNAAEYTQEHLLRQSAIRRYLVRNVSFHQQRTPARAIAEELIIELTQSGYIENDTLPYSVIETMHSAMTHHYENFWRMKQLTQKGEAEEWTLDVLSVEIDRALAKNEKLAIFEDFAFQHYKKTIDREQFTDTTDGYEASLYIAVQRALVKADMANVRYNLLQLYKYPSENIGGYVQFHRSITNAFSSDVTNKLWRYVDRHGAPLRVLKSMIDENKRLPELLPEESRFAAAYETQVNAEYKRVSKRLNKGLIKSIAFLLITKTLLGVLIEIPYDLMVTGTILILPLAINLLAPVIYLLISRITTTMPGKANTDALNKYIENALYENDQRSITLHAKERKATFNVGFTIAYAVMFVVAFGLVLGRLVAWHFHAPQIGLFFVFLATAAYLGFRLTHAVRELELVTAKPGFLQVVRDFLYMPFIVVGRWLSEEYKKINFVALVLDTAIELPLKTFLRLVRQWTSFISDKKDAL
jgi:hypothetical protein